MLVEMQYNGSTNLIIGHRVVKPHSTFYIDEQEIADNINPSLVSSGLITYVNNDGLPAGTISGNLVIVQPQQEISAGNVQDAISQISSFMGTASGTITSLQNQLNTYIQDEQNDANNISVLQNSVTTINGEITTLQNNFNTVNSDYTNLNSEVSSINTSVNFINKQMSSKLNNLLFQTDLSFSGAETSVMLSHDIGNLTYAVMVTPTSNVGSGTFWVEKNTDNIVVNLTTIESGATVTADVVIMS